jgi:glycosyltransferase involved in cell wall biosynthesis
LWYLHRSVTWRLRLASFLSDAVVTADKSSLKLSRSNIVEVGHGIMVSRFATKPDWSTIKDRPWRILSVGRLSPIKDFETLIRAIAELRGRGVRIEARIVGRPVMASDHQYSRDLQELVTELNLVDVITFTGFVSYEDMPHQYQWADLIVGCTPPGGIDKVILEAMAAGCLVLTSNTVMKRHLGGLGDQLIFEYKNQKDLAQKVSVVMSLDPSQLFAMSEELVMLVQEHHATQQVVEKISNLLR